ncbi:MAG: hypothetical protein ACOCT9_02305 [archaeon]
MTEDFKTLLIVKAYPNYEKGKPEYDWSFPDNCPTTRMLGILEMIKYDLLLNTLNLNGEYEDG